MDTVLTTILATHVTSNFLRAKNKPELNFKAAYLIFHIKIDHLQFVDTQDLVYSWQLRSF